MDPKLEAAHKILVALKWCKKRKMHIMKSFKHKLRKSQMMLLKTFKGYMYRKAFLAHHRVYIDVYIPLYQVGSKHTHVCVLTKCDNNWSQPIK